MAVVDGTSPIDAFRRGRMSSDDLLAAVDRGITDGRRRRRSGWRSKLAVAARPAVASPIVLRPAFEAMTHLNLWTGPAIRSELLP